MTQVKQVELELLEPNPDMKENRTKCLTFLRTGKKMICWLDVGNLKEGAIISLKKDESFYEIRDVWGHNAVDHREINRTWHVGGL